MAFTVNIGTATALQIVKLKYEKALNSVSSFELAIEGADSTLRTQFDVSKDIVIYKNGVSDFVGTVKFRSNFQGGGIILRGLGIEEELIDQDSPMVGTNKSRVWTSSNDHTILGALLTGSGWTADTSGSTQASVDSFRTTKSQSIWNSIIALIKQTNKDIRIDQTNKKVYLDDSLGGTNIFAFTESVNVGEVIEEKSTPEAATVEIYGKGDGDSQIFGTSGSGSPIKRITDRNIITTAEATNRAVKELALIVNSTLRYNFTVTDPNLSLSLGDSGLLFAPSVGVNATVNIVRIVRGMTETGTEFLGLEVTNPENRVAEKNAAAIRADKDYDSDMARTSMQGSGNQNLFGSGINAKTGQSLKVPFYVSNAMVSESGALNITAINVSYDLDPFNNQVGSASFDGSDPQVQENSENNDAYTVVAEDDDDVSTGTLSDSWTTLKTWSNIASNGQYIVFYIGVYVVDHTDTSAFSVHARIKNTDSGDYFPNETGVRLVRGEMPFDTSTEDGHSHTVYVTFASSGTIICPINPYLLDFEVQFKQDIPSETANVGAQIVYDVESRHKHNPGAYDINASDLDNISIGDDISEAGSVNASSVNLYLDFWNGSSWINKVTISNTGKTIDTGVDISDSGDFPDAVGYWRVRVEPITATPDYAQATVELKNYMDN